jgi:predicted ATPase
MDTKQYPLVDRSEVLHDLGNTVARGLAGHGEIVFVEGAAGMGKTMLLQMLQKYLGQRPELAKTSLTYGYCYESTGSQSAYQPFIEILETLTRVEPGQKNVRKLMLTLLRETAPDWLQLVPVFGPALSAGVKSASLVREWLLETPNESQTSQSSIMILQYINTISKIAAQQKPLVLVIEDAHWIDDASCQLLLRLSQKIAELPVVVFITYRPGEIHPQHPLQKVQREMLIKGSSRTLRLAGWAEDQIRTYITRRFHTALHPKLAAWLEYLCKGNPLFVTQYLSLLEQDKIIQPGSTGYVLDGDIRYLSEEWMVSGKLANNPIPESVEAVLEGRINRLLEEDKELLQVASVQGDQFMSSLLADLTIKRELDILSQLRRVVERHHIINFYTGIEWLESKSEYYIFEHHLMQQALYKKLSSRERVLHHCKIAESLEHILQQQSGSSRKLVLEIAYHYNYGDEPQLAARYYFIAAQSSFAEGAFTETIELCQKTRECLQKVANQDRMLVEVILLLFVVSENRWQGKPELQGKLALPVLAQDAEEAALRTGDLALLAQTRYLKSKAALVGEGLRRCLQILQEALEIAQQSGDRICEAAIMAEFGHHMIGENLSQGLSLLYQAYDLYQQAIPTETDPNKSHDRALHRIEGLIGVGELDQGRYDEANEWLNKSVNGLKALKMSDDLPRMLNFLGQLYTNMGLFEKAEEVLKEAIDVYRDDDTANAWRGYNLAQLGKLYIEWNSVEKAVEPLVKGWQETQVAWNSDLISLVRNYYAELLMYLDKKTHNAVTVQQLLNTTLEEVRVSGFHRSAIAALSQRSQLALLQGLSEEALVYSTWAVEYLERMGTMPALRTEEVLFNHYLALKANKRELDSVPYLRQTYAVIQKKAESLKNAKDQQAFRERVLINKAIITAFESLPE